MKDLKKKVKEELVTNHGYDFESDWWDDVLVTFMQEVIEATVKILNVEKNDRREEGEIKP